jgi:hypothetical protein
MEAVPPSRRSVWPFTSTMEVDVVPFGRCSLCDVWEAWFCAPAEAECAYREWAEAPQAERGERFARYRAALEREDRAATVLGATVDALDQAA